MVDEQLVEKQYSKRIYQYHSKKLGIKLNHIQYFLWPGLRTGKHRYKTGECQNWAGGLQTLWRIK